MWLGLYQINDTRFQRKGFVDGYIQYMSISRDMRTLPGCYISYVKLRLPGRKHYITLITHWRPAGAGCQLLFTFLPNAWCWNGCSAWVCTINVSMQLPIKSKFGLSGSLWTSLTLIQHNSLSSQSSIAPFPFWFYYLLVDWCFYINIFLSLFVFCSMTYYKLDIGIHMPGFHNMKVFILIVTSDTW
jgi:hypothetical protein